MSPRGEWLVSNVTFMGNSADYGGGIFSSGTVTLTNCTFTENSAGKTGGAIHNEGTLTVEMNNCTVSENTAKESGAGIYTAGTFTADSGVLSGNILSSPSGRGAGIYNNGKLTLYADVKGHTTQANGAALYNDGDGTVFFARGEISENSAENGGAFYNVGTLAIGGGAITRNTAAECGGAVYSTGTLTITNGDISTNTAKSGGGIALVGSDSAAAFTTRFRFRRKVEKFRETRRKMAADSISTGQACRWPPQQTAAWESAR